MSSIAEKGVGSDKINNEHEKQFNLRKRLKVHTNINRNIIIHLSH